MQHSFAVSERKYELHPFCMGFQDLMQRGIGQRVNIGGNTAVIKNVTLHTDRSGQLVLKVISHRLKTPSQHIPNN